MARVILMLSRPFLTNFLSEKNFMPGVSHSFSYAVAQHKAGNLSLAESVYREVISRDPDRGDPHHSDALHLLGLIASEGGDDAAAVALIVRAIETGGPAPVYCSNLGVALSRQGKLDQAVACYRQALKGAPEDIKTQLRLGRTLLSQGRPEDAADVFRAAT